MRISVLTSLLCAAFLFSATELHELVNLPCAIMHYFQHVKDEKGYSLAQFLEDHYAGNTHQKKEHQEHRHLPFKMEHSATSAFFFAGPTFLGTVSKAHVVYELPPRTYQYSRSFSSCPIYDIWQPPRQV